MDKKDKNDRQKRVQFIKNVIIGSVLFLLLLPTLLCIILFFKIGKLDKEIERLRYLKLHTVYAAEQSYKVSQMEKAINSTIVAPSEEDYPDTDEAEGLYAGRVYLTFDDGPGTNTQKILDILDQYDVKATFFVTGKTDALSKKYYKEIIARGHTLGMHSYSHDYGKIYASKKAFASDYKKISSLLTDVTGEKPWVYRFPGGSSNTVSKVDMRKLIDFLDEENVIYYDWNVQCGDAVSVPPDKATIYKNVVNGVKGLGESVVLMHDLPEKKSTVEALPKIIKDLKKGNYKFLPITKNTDPVHHLVSR